MTFTTAILSRFGKQKIGYNSGRCGHRQLFHFSTSTSSPSSSKWVTTTYLQDDDRVAVLRLHRKPANALSLEFCTEISEAIEAVKAEQRATALVVASGLPSRIFSAGLDISRELYQPDADRLPLFWGAFQQLFLDLYGCHSLTTVAALEGPAPAGGCMLALSCDYRVAGASTRIGLNESHLGIVAPPWMCRQYIDMLGHRRAELALLSGTLFPPEEALKAGLVDELVVESDGGNDNEDGSGYSPTEMAAIQKARGFVGIPPAARASVKALTRQPLIDRLEREREKDVGFFCDFVTSPTAQENIGRYLEALAKKNSRPKK